MQINIFLICNLVSATAVNSFLSFNPSSTAWPQRIHVPTMAQLYIN